MERQYFLNNIGEIPSPTSQTTCEWPINSPIGSEYIIGDSFGYNITWDEASREVLDEYMEAWEKLKSL